MERGQIPNDLEVRGGMTKRHLVGRKKSGKKPSPGQKQFYRHKLA